MAGDQLLVASIETAFSLSPSTHNLLERACAPQSWISLVWQLQWNVRPPHFRRASQLRPLGVAERREDPRSPALVPSLRARGFASSTAERARCLALPPSLLFALRSPSLLHRIFAPSLPYHARHVPRHCCCIGPCCRCTGARRDQLSDREFCFANLRFLHPALTVVHWRQGEWDFTSEQQESGAVCGGGSRPAALAWGTEDAFVSISGDEGNTVRILMATSGSASENATVQDASSFVSFSVCHSLKTLQLISSRKNSPSSFRKAPPSPARAIFAFPCPFPTM